MHTGLSDTVILLGSKYVDERIDEAGLLFCLENDVSLVHDLTSMTIWHLGVHVEDQSPLVVGYLRLV